MLLAAMGCVPASEELPPRGAAGFTTVPSPATAGTEDIVTSDGWHVHFDRVVVQAAVSATPLSLGYGNYEPYLFDAARSAEIFSRALPVGSARVRVDLYGRVTYPDGFDYEDDVTRIGVDDETAARFVAARSSNPTIVITGPTVLVVARAERDGVVVRLDAALPLSRETSSGTFDDDTATGAAVEVREDALASTELFVRVEALFPELDAIAAADADRDGVVTEREIEAADLTRVLDRNVDAFLAP